MVFFTIAFYGFITIVAIQVAYYAAFFIGIKKQSVSSGSIKNIPISVIICAKNEAENLKQNIPAILNQDYPNFELVLINDNSFDDTLEVMETFKAKHQNIKIVDVKPIDKFWGNKKYALTLGIKAATHDFLLFTDADCKPISNQWIRAMAHGFSNKKSMVLGYGGYDKKPSFLNKVIRFETLLTGMQYLAYANLGFPYMGVGRNLGYRKSLFLKNYGYMSHMHVASGDDDLFVNAVSNKENTSVIISPSSFTSSKAKETFKAWIRQKRRHISTSKHYKIIHKSLLALFYISQLGFWSIGLLLLTKLYVWKIVLTAFLCTIIIKQISYYYSSKCLNEKDLFFIAPFLEMFLIFAQLYIFIANRFSKPVHWK